MDSPSRTPAGGPGAPSGGRNLAAAVLVGLALVGLFLGSLAWHPVAFTALVAVLLIVAIIEGGRVLAREGRPVAVPVLLVASLVMLGGAHSRGESGQVLGVLALILGTIAWYLVDTRRRDVLARAGLTVLLGLWIGLLASYAALLVTRPRGGSIAVIAVIGAAVVSDVGAYAAGSLLGRHRIAPGISPHKTWEGLAGGILLTTVTAAAVLPQLGDLFGPALAAAVGAVVAVAGFVGDLGESMIKRDLGVKDLGAVLPGHGGVLDRVDGILVALPVGHLAIELLT